MNYKYILFDLDGTLSDPRIGITKSVAYALEHYNIKVENTDELCCFIGPPLSESFVKYYGFSVPESFKAIDIYRERFSTVGLYENVLYDGIPALLETLKAAGAVLAVATSKPTVFAKKILDYFNIPSCFSGVFGSELDGTRVKKDEVIAYALKEMNITDKSKAVMVGDREHDIIGAAKNNLDSVGVLYGYGSEPELTAASATHIAATPAELGALLLGNEK